MFSKASALEASNFMPQRASLLRDLVCEPVVPRRGGWARDRIVPMIRPVRGRGIYTPKRPPLLNAIAKRGRSLIRKHGALIKRCECCKDCTIPCAMPKYPLDDGLSCGPCTPRSLLVAVGGVEPCGCTYVEDPPREDGVGIWARATGQADGVHCATPNGAEPIFNAQRCVYYTLLPISSCYLLNATKDDCDAGSCDGTSAYCPLFVEMLAGPPPLLQARIRTGGSGGLQPFASEAEIFWGQTAFKGWQATHTIINILSDCGIWPSDTDPFLEGTWILGKSGSMVIRPCCPI